MSYYVCIDELSDQELGILGYTKILENEDFKVYRCYDGTDHIVAKSGKRFLKVDDVNDAMAMGTVVITLPKPPPFAR